MLGHNWCSHKLDSLCSHAIVMRKLMMVTADLLESQWGDSRRTYTKTIRWYIAVGSGFLELLLEDIVFWKIFHTTFSSLHLSRCDERCWATNYVRHVCNIALQWKTSSEISYPASEYNVYISTLSAKAFK